MTRDISVAGARRARREVERAGVELLASLALALPDAEQIIAAAYDVHVSAMDYPSWANANPWSKLDFVRSATALISVLHTRGMVVGLSSSPPILEKNDREAAK